MAIKRNVFIENILLKGDVNMPFRNSIAIVIVRLCLVISILFISFSLFIVYRIGLDNLNNNFRWYLFNAKLYRPVCLLVMDLKIPEPNHKITIKPEVIGSSSKEINQWLSSVGFFDCLNQFKNADGNFDNSSFEKKGFQDCWFNANEKFAERYSKYEYFINDASLVLYGFADDTIIAELARPLRLFLLIAISSFIIFILMRSFGHIRKKNSIRLTT